jgi:hypothetical protein
MITKKRGIKTSSAIFIDNPKNKITINRGFSIYPTPKKSDAIKGIGYKKAQLSAFIIIALLLAIILIIFLFRKDIFGIVGGEKDPVSQIRDCVTRNTKEAVGILNKQGGFLEPENYYLYKGNKVEYLCYSANYYEKCVMQKPFITQDIEKEIKKYITPKIQECMSNVKEELEKDGSAVTMKKADLNVSLVPEHVIVDVDSDITISKGNVQSYKSIKTDVNSNLYDLAMIASSITNWEARYGNSETLNYMLYYPQIKVEKKKQEDGTTIYILTERDSKDIFMFASRSVAIPPGLLGA